MNRRSFHKTRVLLVPVFLLALVSCAAPDRGGYPPPYTLPEELPEQARRFPDEDGIPVVRVLLLETDDRISLDVPGGRVSAISADGQTLGRFEVGGALAVSRAGGGLRLRQRGSPPHEAPSMMIRPTGGAGFTIDDTPYRGGVLLRRSGRNIQAINVIKIEDYLKGVLPAEIGYLEEGQYEAYEVQAIAARSYSLSKLEEKEGEPYDMRATIMDQVYRGIKGENRIASAAVDATRGIVGIWDGRPIRAYYSSCCGGHTADVRVGWPWKAHYPYLYGVRDAASGGGESFCRSSRHFRWEAVWSGGDLSRIVSRTVPAELGERVPPFNIVRDIRVTRYAPSGRAVSMEIVTDNGTHMIDGDRIRWVLRPESPSGPILRSTLFKMEVSRGGGRVRKLRLVGGGNGHGVGMCQTGAIGMASAGFGAESILEHYYPGITLEAIY